MNETWKRNLIILCLAQFIAMIGMNGLVPFLPIFVRELGATDPANAKFWSGMAFAGPYFLSVIAVPFWGALGDKYGRKKMIIRATIGLGFAVFLMGFSQSVQQLFALRVFQGAVSGFLAAALAFATTNSPKNRTGYSIGLLQSSSSAGIIIGPFFGGLISDFVGPRPVFFIVASFCAMSALLLFFFVKENFKPNENNTDSTVWSNLKYMAKSKKISLIVFLIISAQSGILITNPIFPYFVEELHAPKQYLATITGTLISVVGFASILFAPYWGKRNDSKDYKKTFRVACSVCGIGILSHLLVPHYIYLYPIRAVIGVFFSAIIPTLYSALSKIAPEENKGGIMSIASSGTLLGSLFSYLLSGVLTSNFPMYWTFIISGLILLMVAFPKFKD